MKIVLISADESQVGMGVRTLSACLQEEGFDTTIVLMPTFEEGYGTFTWEDLFVLCKDAGLIGISCMTHAVAKAIEIRRQLDTVVSVPIVAGGIHASLSPESLLEDFTYVCHGEGEDLMVQMARCLENGDPFNNLPGLYSKQNGVVGKNPAAPLEKGIGDYPFPDYDLTHQFIMDGNRLVQVQPILLHMGLEEFVILGSRGCPHRCTYCCNKKIKEDFPWRKKVLHYSVDYLIDHLKNAKSLFPQIESFWIEDDTFFAKKQEEIELFADRYKEEVGIPFKILISPWTYKEEKLAPLVDAGMSKLMMGVQSGCERVNKELYDRNMTNERLLGIAESLHKYTNLLKCYDFIGMNPFENSRDTIETIEFVMSLPKPFYIFSNNLAFYPGTELHAKAIDANLDISRRVKHSEADIGYRILIHEKLRHKTFHLIFLSMAGMVTPHWYGRIPKLFLSKPMLSLFFHFDRILPWASNGFAVAVAWICYRCNWKKIVKKVFSPRAISKIRHLLGR